MLLISIQKQGVQHYRSIIEEVLLFPSLMSITVPFSDYHIAIKLSYGFETVIYLCFKYSLNYNSYLNNIKTLHIFLHSHHLSVSLFTLLY